MRLPIAVSHHREELAETLSEALHAHSKAVEVRPVREPVDLTHAPPPAVLLLTGGDRDGYIGTWSHAVARVGCYLLLASGQPHGPPRSHQPAGVECFAPDRDPARVATRAIRLARILFLQKRVGMVGRSLPLRRALGAVLDVAAFEGTRALITGESGSGKESMARGVHEASLRCGRPFVAVNVASLSDTLVESELFGHVKGAFTGAFRSHKGCFERADGGTLLLDEISELPFPSQAKLLRVLEAGLVRRVGGEEDIPVDVRVITATNRNLHELARTKSFRTDLYYRLDVLRIRVPSLRERPEDIPLLVKHFADAMTDRGDEAFPGISEEGLRQLLDHSWPGNVRELSNVVARLSLLSTTGEQISASAVRNALSPASRAPSQVDRSRRHIPQDVRQTAAYQEFRYHMELLEEESYHRARTAERLGIHRSTLSRRLSRWNGLGWLDRIPSRSDPRI